MQTIYKLSCLVVGTVLFVLSVVLKQPGGMGRVAQLLHISQTRRWGDLAVLALMILSVGLVAAAGAVRPTVRHALRQFCRCRRDAVIAGVWMTFMVVTLVPVGRGGQEMVLYLSLAGSGFSLLLIGLWPLPLRWGEPCIRSALSRLKRMRLPAFLAAVFLVEFIAANLASYFIFEHIPHILDSIAQVFEASLFAHGHMAWPAPPHALFFEQPSIVVGPRWYSMYPPQHSLMLTPSVWLGIPWITNPLLGALTVVTFYFLGRELYNDAVGRVAACLAVLSPFLLFMSAEFMNHSTALLVLSLFLLAYARTVRTQSWTAAIVAGISLGLATVRPLSAMAFAMPFVGYALVLVLRAPRRYLPPFVVLALACGISLLGFLLYNRYTTGNVLTPGYAVTGHALGFVRGLQGPRHTPMRGLEHTLAELNALQKYLFEWPLPSLLLVPALFLSKPRRKWDSLLLAAWIALTVGYFFYWYEHLCFGPRFQFEALGVLVLLSARGLQRLPELVRERCALAVPSEQVQHVAALVIGLSVLVAGAVNLWPLVTMYSDSYNYVNGNVYHSIHEQNVHNAVVFVNSNYSSVFLGNFTQGLDLNGDIVYVRNLAGAGDALMQAYPGRRYYLADGALLTEVRDPLVLLNAQVHKWDSTWRLDGCAATPTGLMRSNAARKYVFQTYSADPEVPCALTRKVTVGAAPQFFHLRVAADARPDAAWELRVSVNRLQLDGRTISADSRSGRWQDLRYDLSPYAGREITIRLEHASVGVNPAVGYWAFARITGQSAPVRTP